MSKAKFYQLLENPPEAGSKAPSARTKADWRSLAEHYKETAAAGRRLLEVEKKKAAEREAAPPPEEMPGKSVLEQAASAAISIVAGTLAGALAGFAAALKKIDNP